MLCVSFESDWLKEWREFFGPITEGKQNQNNPGLHSTLKVENFSYIYLPLLVC